MLHLCVNMSAKPSIAKKQKLQVSDPVEALREVRYRYAADVAKQADIIYQAAQRLQAIEAAMAREAVKIAGEDYQVNHVITFDGHGSIDNQMETIGMVEGGAGFDDIAAKAFNVKAEALSVAESKLPPPLPYEKIEDC
jgi:hypothetical protein